MRCCSVLCEKPFTNNAAEAMAVQRASEDAGCIAVEAMHPLLHPVAMRSREIVLSGDIGKLVHIDVQFVVNFSGYDEGVRSDMHDPTPMYEDQRFDSDLGGGAMMDLGCYCISALRNLANEEPRCTSAVPDIWSEDAEIDLGMSADFVYPSGATAHFDNSFVGGDKAGPVVVTVTGSKGTLTIEGYNGTHPASPLLQHATRTLVPAGSTPGEWLTGVLWRIGGGNQGNALTVKVGDGEPTVETVDSPPNTRSTMYYQLSAFVDEVRACEALPADQRAKSWTYSLKPSPVRPSPPRQTASRSICAIPKALHTANQSSRLSSSKLELNLRTC
jgi:predicted dehydrogenase